MVEVNKSHNSLLVDLGTNSLILTVLNINENKLNILFEKSITTRIGEGIHTENEINVNAYARTKKALLETLQEIDRQRIGFSDNFAICTEAIRSATNGQEILNRLKTETKINFELVKGKEEAKYSYLACSHYLHEHINAIIADIGGGSTELNFITDGKLENSISIPIGAVQLENLLGISKSSQALNAARQMINYSIALYTQKPELLIFCGGTATTVASIKLSLQQYDPSKVEGLPIKKIELALILNKLAQLRIDEIQKLLSYDPKRADVITAGICIMDCIYDKFNPPNTIVTTLGPRHGYFIEKNKIRSIDGINYAEKT